MKKAFELVTPFRQKSVEEDGLKIQGLASTNDVDRAGDVIALEAWKSGGMDNYLNNPVILFNHNADKPIGRAESLQVTPKGLELGAKISKAAGKPYDLIEDGVLGAFSVSFLIKDADYIEETGGLKIKDVDLLEISVVSIPCNQAATFSLAKSFDSKEEYENFKKTFTNSVDSAGLETPGTKDNSDNPVTTPAEGSDDPSMETNMDPKELKAQMEAIARKAAEDAAAAQAMKAAEEKAKREAEEKAKREADEALKSTVAVQVASGTEKLMEDFQAQLNAKDTELEETIKRFEARLKEHKDEMTNIRNSKRVFGNRTEESNLKEWSSEILAAHMLGVITGKGWETDYANELAEKAGIDYVTNAADLDQEIKDEIQKEMTRELRVASLFRHIPVNGAATVLPIQPDVGLAEWQPGATLDATYQNFTGNLENNPQGTADTYQPKQVILNAYRLISSTYMDNDVDEQVLVNLMPMLVEGVARAHARSIERMCLTGDGLGTASNIAGLNGYAAEYSGQIDLDGSSVAAGDSAVMTADLLLGMRQSMGKYGVSPTELVYIVSQNSYFDLLSDAKFQTLDEVGSDLAVRVTGSLGAVYGTPVVVSDEFPAETAGAPAAFCVWTRNYVIPVLRDIKVEQDYEVGRQRRIIVASQSTGFNEILPGNGAGIEPSMKITFTA